MKIQVTVLTTCSTNVWQYLCKHSDIWSIQSCDTVCTVLLLHGVTTNCTVSESGRLKTALMYTAYNVSLRYIYRMSIAVLQSKCWIKFY